VIPEETLSIPRLTGRIKGVRGLRRPEEILPAGVNAEQRLLILDMWRRSGLPSGDFAGGECETTAN